MPAILGAFGWNVFRKAREVTRGVKIGVATSVRQYLWDEAEVYPTPKNARLMLSEEQREFLAHFQRSGGG